MGQKTNPNILRLGINKTWKSEFFEKKSHELPLYNFKVLEMKSYLLRFFNYHGILIHSCKEHFNEGTLNLNISYFISPDFFYRGGSKDRETLVFINDSGNQKRVTIQTQIISNYSNYSLEDTSELRFSREKLYLCRKYLNNSQNLSFTQSRRENNSINVDVVKQLFKVLSIFMGDNTDISANFSCLNRNLSFLKSAQQKNLLLLQKFRNISFATEGIELLFYVVHCKDSAMLLARFIRSQIQKTKRHKLLISFLKHFLTILLDSKMAIVKGVKIMIKGRLNGVPRAKHKTIIVGDVPIQTFDTKLNFYQAVAHNASGSYGISVWLVEKM